MAYTILYRDYHCDSRTLNMYLFTLTLLITQAVISHGSYSKCCQFGKYLVNINSTYECVENEQKRQISPPEQEMEILSNDTDFLARNLDGECAEVSTDFFIFNVSGGKILGKRPVTEAYFPKCCPLNYTYNTVLHACDKGQSMTYDYIQGNFIKVGLPNCKVVVDYINDTVKYEYKLINEQKKLKRNSHPYPGSYCIDEDEKGSTVIRECKDSLEVCEDIRCIKKCCPDGQSFINRAKCYNTFTHGLNLTNLSVIDKPEDPYAIIFNRTCPQLYRMEPERYTVGIDAKGMFRYWENSTLSYAYEDIGNMWSYCIEYSKKQDIEGYFFFMCFLEGKHEEKFLYTAWAKILSCMCLVLTISIYVFLNEMKKLFGKILINYCAALLIENIVLLYAQLNLHSSVIECQFKSFLIIFFATAVFSWLNVLCCDIWWTFGSTKRSIGSDQRRRDMKKLYSYLWYGWGVPSIHTLIIFLFYMYPVLPYSIQPYLAIVKCFFENKKGNYAQALFFNFPHLIIQIINTVLFVKTVTYCLRVKNEINRISDSTRDDKKKRFQKDKEGLHLILKLSSIMGVSFMFEVASAFVEMSEMGLVPRYIEIVWDTINCLQGVFIFLIFICKKKIYHDFLLKCKLLRPESVSMSSIHTQSTSHSNGTSMRTLQAFNDTEKDS